MAMSRMGRVFMQLVCLLPSSSPPLPLLSSSSPSPLLLAAAAAAAAGPCAASEAQAQGPGGAAHCDPGLVEGDESGLLQLKLYDISRPQYQYNDSHAKVMATLSKLTYCGGWEGTAASVEHICGSQGPCREAGVKIKKGGVRALSVHDGHWKDAIFAFAANLESKEGAVNPLRPGCVVAVRGGWPGTNNKERIRETKMALLGGNTSCTDCLVHQGFQQMWKKLMPELIPGLEGLECSKTAPLYLTGHSMGGPVSMLGMLHLKLLGWNVQHSYNFHSYKLGNKAFVKYFNKVLTGSEDGAAVTRVTFGKDNIPTWPWEPSSDGSYYAYMWPEVHYRRLSEGGLGSDEEFTYDVCTDEYAGSCTGSQEQLCKKGECDDHATMPIAPAGNILVFADPLKTCLLGNGTMFEGMADLPEVAKKRRPFAEGLQWMAHQLISFHARSKYIFNQTHARAMAALVKLTYCDGHQGTALSAEHICGPDGPCSDAGVRVKKGSVRVLRLPDEDSPDAVVAVIHELEGAPGAVNPMHPGVLVAIRGTRYNTNNRNRSLEQSMVPLRGVATSDECEACKVHEGFQKIWFALRKGLLPALEDMGLSKAKPVYFSGHSMGGVVSMLGMLHLKALGWNVQHSYLFHSPRLGNKAFVKYFNKVITGSEHGAAVTRVTFGRDITPTWAWDRRPDGSYYAYTWPEAHYRYVRGEHPGEEEEEEFTVDVCTDEHAGRCMLSHCVKDCRKDLCREHECDHHLVLPIAPARNMYVMVDPLGTCLLGMGTPYEEAGELPDVARDHRPYDDAVQWMFDKLKDFR